MTTILEGYDAAKYQNLVPWEKVSFGFVRVSHGKGADLKAPEHVAAMRAAGVEIGAYHYLRGDSPGYEQADYFWTLVCDLGGGESFALAVDLEHLNKPHPPWDRKVYRYRYFDFLKRLRELSGRVCATYSYRSFLQWLMLTGMEIGDSPLWLSDVEGDVEIPAPWADWTIHQYSYGGGKLDHNRFRGTRQDFRRVFGLLPSQADQQLGALADRVRLASGMLGDRPVMVEEGPVIPVE